jgi:FixJ family two-component response regulator
MNTGSAVKAQRSPPTRAKARYFLDKPTKIIAVVEDDASMQRSIVRLLEARGFGTRPFASAEEFLDDESAGEVVCLILDIQLNGISGIELRRRLAASGSGLPVIFITGIDDEAVQQQAIEAGCVAYLRKPFAANQLIEAINKAIR